MSTKVKKKVNKKAVGIVLVYLPFVVLLLISLAIQSAVGMWIALSILTIITVAFGVGLIMESTVGY